MKTAWLKDNVDKATEVEGTMIAGCYFRSGVNEFSKELLKRLGEELDTENYLIVKTVIENMGVNV